MIKGSLEIIIIGIIMLFIFMFFAVVAYYLSMVWLAHFSAVNGSNSTLLNVSNISGLK